jgi:AcrR family transcriptional regulator
MTDRRTYRLQRRAESQAETRRRITEAAVELHGSVGPANTTVSEIARRAGVQRLTVYTHFPDQRSLFEACTTHWFGLHPPPEPAAWEHEATGEERVRRALESLYIYYRANERMIANWLRDAQIIPVLREFAEAGYYGLLDRIAISALPADAPDQTRAIFLVAAHFETWRTLALRRGLDDAMAAAAMTRGILAAGSVA